MPLSGTRLPASPMQVLSQTSMRSFKAKRGFSTVRSLIGCSIVFLGASAVYASTVSQLTRSDPTPSQCDTAMVCTEAATPISANDQPVFSTDGTAGNRAGLLLAKRPPQCGNGILEDGEICEIDDSGPSCAALGIGSNTDPLPCNSTCTGWDTSLCQ